MSPNVQLKDYLWWLNDPKSLKNIKINDIKAKKTHIVEYQPAIPEKFKKRP